MAKFKARFPHVTRHDALMAQIRASMGLIEGLQALDIAQKRVIRPCAAPAGGFVRPRQLVGAARMACCALALLMAGGCATYRSASKGILNGSERVVTGAIIGGVTGPTGVYTLQGYDEQEKELDDEGTFRIGLSAVCNGGVLFILSAACGPCVWWYAGAGGALGILEQTAIRK